MAQTNRVNLKSYFLTGSKPTQSQFADLVDSLINIKDDGITPDGSGNVVFNQGVILGNTSLDTAGSIRWNGTNFQFRDGAGWNNLGFGSGSQWTSIGADIVLPTGNIGIGLAVDPTYRLEVNTNNTVGTANPTDTVRLGAAAIFQDSAATYISHRSVANTSAYALSQDNFGNTALNCGAGKSISFLDGATPKATLSGGVFSIGNPPVTPGALLVVNGNAAKPVGGMWIATSDERLKKDITAFKDGLQQLKKLRPVSFRFNGKAGIAGDAPCVGLIAQEVEPIFPYMVGNFRARLEESDKKETDLLSLDASALSYVIINAIKELDARLAELEGKKLKTTTTPKKHTL